MEIAGRDASVKFMLVMAIFILPVLLMYPVHAENLNIVSVDSTTFPNIKVNVYTPCPDNLTAKDFIVKENGKDVINKNVSFRGRSLDLVVVFDDTGSMSNKIDAMKSKVQDLISQINAQGLDTRYSLVTFKDEVQVRMNWERNPNTFRTYAVEAFDNE